jgi:PH-interacting protein
MCCLLHPSTLCVALPIAMQILAAASDNNIRVWCPHSGMLLRLLCGHSDQAHVLEVHPFEPHLAMSAGYDGQVILWDTAQGSILKK